jgi:hypothetical protein
MQGARSFGTFDFTDIFSLLQGDHDIAFKSTANNIKLNG